MQPIGLLIKLRLKEDGHSIAWFARSLACSRANIYKIFEKTSIDTNQLMRVSKILNYDFFQDYSEEFDKSSISKKDT